MMKPIGRCDKCGVPSYEIDALNLRCDCGEGIVGSVAVQDWRPCIACFQTGEALLYGPTLECQVCHGAGWITEAEAFAAWDEVRTMQAALKLWDDGPWPPRHYNLSKSRRGSISIIRRELSRATISQLRRAIDVIERFRSRTFTGGWPLPAMAPKLTASADKPRPPSAPSRGSATSTAPTAGRA